MYAERGRLGAAGSFLDLVVRFCVEVDDLVLVSALAILTVVTGREGEQGVCTVKRVECRARSKSVGVRDGCGADKSADRVRESGEKAESTRCQFTVNTRCQRRREELNWPIFPTRVETRRVRLSSESEEL